MYTDLLLWWKTITFVPNQQTCTESTKKDMEALSVRDYRNNLAASFDRAAKGERVIIRRKNQIYALIRVGNEDLTITPALQKRIDEAEMACREGRCVSCSTEEELDAFFNSL